MTRGHRLLAALAGVGFSFALAIGPAAAHRPYFSAPKQTLTLPGSKVEIGIAWGDGIIGPDPGHVVVIGQDDRLLARSEEGHALGLSCGARTCVGYDGLWLQALVPDPASFLANGPLVNDRDADSYWELVGRQEVGFKRRFPTPVEIVRGEWALAVQHGLLLSLLALYLAASGIWSTLRWGLSPERDQRSASRLRWLWSATNVCILLLMSLSLTIWGVGWLGTLSAVGLALIPAWVMRLAIARLRGA